MRALRIHVGTTEHAIMEETGICASVRMDSKEHTVKRVSLYYTTLYVNPLDTNISECRRFAVTLAELFIYLFACLFSERFFLSDMKMRDVPIPYILYKISLANLTCTHIVRAG